ncbi:Chaperonin 60 subunit beta 3, chloroplastic-like protein [Heracleum sosnowskyi]|uniref:Chaperonin 60 subunit beta 3, chloroplastic-like protein n=1 Tax=Heracleum sosnowskyi TaxID=360622 RepID=A0AAD8HI70_9APIA|nr:Chaperonin 60 subunit beta 3, chloroplastic-like protein [Heracleum sosnowskyi]
MACWSAENATKAYLQTIKLGMNAKEPNVGEFISAFAAGNNAQLMVIACATTAGCTTVGLNAAAYRTGGRVICIVRGSSELTSSIDALGCNASRVEFVIGEAQTLLSTKYTNADLVVIDCNIENYEGIFKAAEVLTTRGDHAINNKIVLGYNALFCNDLLRWDGSKTQYLPIGEGLLIRRIGAKSEEKRKRSHWIVRVDECTGEEHVFRIRSHHRRVIKA